MDCWAEHRADWMFVSVPEVLDPDFGMAIHAQDIVNRNEMMFRYIDQLMFFDEEKTYLKGESREEKLQWYMTNIALKNATPGVFDFPPLSLSLIHI